MREAEELLSFALELQESRQKKNAGFPKSKTGLIPNQIKETKELYENKMKVAKNEEKGNTNSKMDDLKLKEEDIEKYMTNNDFFEVNLPIIKDKKNLAVKIENIK